MFVILKKHPPRYQIQQLFIIYCYKTGIYIQISGGCSVVLLHSTKIIFSKS
jgi:hypothetical protein